MMNLAFSEIAAATGGDLVASGPPARGVSTDTRSLQRGDLFFALLGEDAAPGSPGDGHSYVQAAAAAGAAGAVVSRAVEGLPSGFGVVEVHDTLLALGRLAATWRQRVPARVVAVTGSVGKTSTKGLLGSILALAASSVIAERSYNNEIGVPLTLLRLNRGHTFCALEFAMRGPGQIGYLAGLARPEIGVITNIGTSHAELLGSRKAIAHAKGELLFHLPRTGRAVLRRGDAFFALLADISPAPVLSFGLSAEAEVRAERVEDQGFDGTRFDCVLPGSRASVRLRIPGLHNVENALAAAAAAHALGIATETIAEGLEGYEGTEMRSRVVHAPGGWTVIDDSYNAAPDSVAAALALLAGAEGRRIFVFGDMLELGDDSAAHHQAVGLSVADAGVARLLAVGDLARLAAESAADRGVDVSCHSSAEEALGALRDELQPGDVILVKASRRMRLERVVEGLLTDA